MAGMVTGERTHTGGVNNYSGTDDSDVTINGINLAIAKDDQVVNTLPGQIIIYDIDYSNTGNASANNIVITETVPEYTTFSSASSSVGWSCVDGSIAGTVCTYEVPQILALGLGTVDFAVTVLPLADIGRSITQIINSLSIASATSDGIDADLSNNSFTLNTDFQVADVLITKIESIDPVFIDHDYSYTLTITNNGPNIATNILLEDTLPDGVSYRGYTSTGASCIYINPQFSCSLSSLAVGASEIIMLDVTGDTPGVKNNTASIRHDQQDPNLGNNSYTESTLVDPADIVLTKNVDKTTATVGDVVTYTITATNNGPDNATGVSVTDQLPSLLEFVSAKPTQGSCTGTVSVVCSIGSMNNGAVVTVTLQARILGVGIIVNSVNSTLNEFDPVLSNNTNIGVTLSAVAKSPSTGFNQQGYTSIILLLSSASVLLVSAKKYYKYVKKTANTPDQ